MSGRVEEIGKSPVEVVLEEVKRKVATDSLPSLEKSEFIKRPSSEFQVSLEVMNDRVSGTELTVPLLQDGEPGGVSMNGYRNTEVVASPIKQVFLRALSFSKSQTEVPPAGTTEREVVSAVGTQNYTNKALKFINDMPPEISDKIMLKICRPRDLASLCLTSRKLNALAAPILYKDIRLGITQGTMFNPRLLHSLIIPEQRNLVHCRVIGVYNESKRGIVEDTGQTSSATEHMYGMCLLLRDVLRKIPRDHLQSFTWYPDASPHSMILEHLRKFQTKIEELGVFMPLFNPDYRILSNIGGCTSLSTLIVGNIRTTSHLIQLNKLLEKCSKIKSLSLRIEPSMSLQDRQKLLIPDNLIRPDTKHKPSVVELRNFPIAQIPQTLKSYISLDLLRILMLVSCENDKELLAAIMASGKKAKLARFDLVTLTPGGIPEFLSSLQSTLKCLHLYFKEMDAGFGNDLIDSIVSHKDSLEILTIDGRFQTTNTAVAPSRDHLLSLKKLYRLKEFAFSPEHYSSDREIRALHALLPCSLRSLNCRIKFNSQMDLPHWANGYALHFISACLKSYSRPLNTDEWGASFGISSFDDYPEIHTKGFNPKQLEIFVLGYVSEIGMIYEVQIVKDRHGTERPLVTEITQDEASFICDQYPQFLNLVY